MKKSLCHFVSIVGLAVLTGCSGFDYAMKTYGETKPVKFTSQERVWRIFDKPEDQIMMVTPGIGDVFQTAPVTYFRFAALEYLKSTGRTCQVTSTREVVDPQWEFTYECRS